MGKTRKVFGTTVVFGAGWDAAGVGCGWGVGGKTFWVEIEARWMPTDAAISMITAWASRTRINGWERARTDINWGFGWGTNLASAETGKMLCVGG